MSVPVASGLTYDDLHDFPDDHLRRELIDGELYVTPSPVRRHQRVALEIAARLLAYVKQHGGEVLPAPADVYFSPTTVVEPDVVFVGRERVALLRDERYIDVPPDLVVEVSSPSTRRLDLIKKRALYEREGVPEYWFVDLDARAVVVHRLRDGRYPAPAVVDERDVLDAALFDGFSFPVAALLRDVPPGD